MQDSVEAHRVQVGQLLENEDGPRVSFKESYVLSDGEWRVKLLDIDEVVLFDGGARELLVVVVNASL